MKINGNPDGGGGASAVIEGLAVTSNGTYTAGEGVDGYSPVEVNVPAPEFVTETLSVSVNNTYYPGTGVDGFSQVIVDVPQSVTGFTEKEITEQTYNIYNLNNSAAFVHQNVFEEDQNILTINLPSASYIGSEAFKGCRNLTSVNAPVCETIYPSAFMGCYSLSYISFPECITARENIFSSCSMLQSVYFPKCTDFSGNCFVRCENLTDTYFPEVKNVGVYTFSGCTKLSEISLPKASLISFSAFKECYSLKQVYIPNCQQLGQCVFDSCYALESLSLPILRRFEGQNTFRNCSSLSRLDLCTNAYWTVGYQNNTFQNTPILTGSGSIYVRSETYNRWITSTGWSSLADRFVSVSFSEPALSFSNGILYGITKLIAPDYSSYMGISSKTDVLEIDLPNLDTRLDYFTFAGYSLVTSINLPAMSSCYANFFSNCFSLNYVNIPNCTYIGEACFSLCSSLSEINLPNVSFIGNYAFWGCQALSKITIGWSSICSIYNYTVFYLTSIYYGTGSIYVPASLVDAYKSAPYWSQYSSQIFPIE